MSMGSWESAVVMRWFLINHKRDLVVPLANLISFAQDVGLRLLIFNCWGRDKRLSGICNGMYLFFLKKTSNKAS